MDDVIVGFLKRNHPDFENCFHVEIDESENDYFCVTADKGVVTISAKC